MSLTLPQPLTAGAARTGRWAAILIGFSLPISTAFDNLLLAVVLLAWLLCGDWRGKWERLRTNPVALVLLAFVLLAALGTAWGLGSGGERLRYFNKYADLLLAILLVTLPLSAADRWRALLAFAAAMALTLIMSYLLRAGLLPLALLPAPPNPVNFDRMPQNPVIFKLHITQGLFMGLTFLFAATAALHVPNPRWRWLAAGFALLAAGGVLIILGRTGYVTLAVVGAYLFLHRFRWYGLAAGLAALVAAGVLLSQMPNSPLVARFQVGLKEMRNWQYGRPDESSMGLRMQFAATSLRIIADHPLLGVGTGGFEHAYREKISVTEARVSNNPHNQYLLSTVQLGLPGLLALLAVFVVAWRAAARLEPPYLVLARGFLLAFAAGNLFNSFLLDHAEGLFFAWLLGVLFSGLPPARPSAARA